jgi:hypothetical protein
MSIWTPGKISKVGTRFALGVPLSYRKLASGTVIPSQAERLKLYGKVANWYTMFNSTLAPNTTQQTDFTAQGGMIIVALMGSVVKSTGGFALAGFCTVQFYDASNQILWSNSPINFENMLGSASQPFWLRSPYHLQQNAHLKVQVQNLSTTVSTTVQVAAFGYQD